MVQWDFLGSFWIFWRHFPATPTYFKQILGPWTQARRLPFDCPSQFIIKTWDQDLTPLVRERFQEHGLSVFAFMIPSEEFVFFQRSVEEGDGGGIQTKHLSRSAEI